MLNEWRIDKIVDTDAYPIDRPESGEFDALCQRVRAELTARGSCTLTGFIRENALARMASEASSLAALAYPGPTEASPYFFNYRLGDGIDVDEQHPLRRVTPRRMAQVATDLIPDEHVLSQLYRCDEMPDFLSAVREQTVYRNADQFQALNISVMERGGCQQWHFDGGDMTTTLMLQEPQAGGVFEYAQDLRSPSSENFEEVRKVLDGDRSRVREVRLRAGTLSLFRGHYSMHRVTPVQGERQRLLAILGYTTEANFHGNLESSVLHYGERVLQQHNEHNYQ